MLQHVAIYLKGLSLPLILNILGFSSTPLLVKTEAVGAVPRGDSALIPDVMEGFQALLQGLWGRCLSKEVLKPLSSRSQNDSSCTHKGWSQNDSHPTWLHEDYAKLNDLISCRLPWGFCTTLEAVWVWTDLFSLPMTRAVLWFRYMFER